MAACLNLDSTPSPVLLVRNAIPAFNFLYTSDTEHPKPHPRSQLSSQPHPHHFICLGHDSRSADVRTGSFDPTSQLLTSKTKQNTEHRDVREPRGCVPLSTLDQIIRRHVHTCFESLLKPKLANSVKLYQIRPGATMHLLPEQDSSTVDYPKRGKKNRRCTSSHCPSELITATALQLSPHLPLSPIATLERLFSGVMYAGKSCRTNDQSLDTPTPLARISKLNITKEIQS